MFWFGFLAFFVVMILFTKDSEGGPPLFVLIVPVFMGVFGFFLMKKMVWDLADQVTDAGDSLIIRFGNEQEQIPLSNIINVSYSYMMSPPRVTLTLRASGRFGNEVSFSPPQSFVPFAKSSVITSLIQRVEAARRT
jgi:hypothetical protein